MKRLFLILVLVLAAVQGRAAEQTAVNFSMPAEWSEVTAAAKAQGKYIFLDGYTEWCSWCKVMDRETFSDEEVGALMNEKFVNVKMEMETGGGIDVAMKYRIHAFPQFLIFDQDGKLVYRILGYVAKNEFIPELKKALDPATQMSFAGITTKMDLPYPDFLRKTYVKGKEKEFADQETVDAWLDSYASVGDEISWTVMTRLSLSEKWENWILAHAAELEKSFGMEYEQKRNDIVVGRLEAAVEAFDHDALERSLELIPNTAPYKNRVAALYQIKLHSAKNEWEEAASVMAAAYATESISGTDVNEASWAMYENCDDKAALTMAADVMKDVCNTAGWAEWDTYASLLFKIGDLDAAEKAASAAIKKGREEKQNTSSTEELLEKIRTARK